ncbi:uncharacterized protein LOC127527535 [Erpetoichthys calabaricus]|uniref:uncharacterized protein LOC127527535 n=1 Tax=Erpetoichthys calabaricus TaxID=27687 RepID=UPI002234819A|nr:uncharacterized protein LOC127527535 [Erpetoichthys calabaricus]
MKHDMLEKLAETMYSFKAYPDDNDFSSVAKALISKHPCLTEPGPQPGWYRWKNSLKFKMANYCSKLRKAGCEDFAVNGSKRSRANPEGEAFSKNIKWPRRGEANYLPNLPEGHEKSLEDDRNMLVEEMKIKQPNGSLISKLMDLTFPLRRREIVRNEAAVQDMAERWPALFMERQVFAEFNRIASKNLEGDFFEALDQYTPSFIQLFSCKKGTVGKKLTEMKQQIDLMTPDVTARRTVVLKGLPIVLGDNSSDFYVSCFDTTKEEAFASLTVGVLTVLSEDGPSSLPISTAIVLEGGIAMDNIKNFPQAVCLLFGLMYALHLDYPKCMANTLKFIQMVMLGLRGKSLPPKLLTLKNSLLVN